MQGAAGEPGEAGAEADLLRQLEEARQELAETRDRLLRAAADFENTKKRLQRERETDLKYAEERLLRELLPGLDNIERAMEQGRETQNIESLLEGVDMTHRGLVETLEKFGVVPVDSVGKPFDPNVHEALAMEESAEADDNTVLREFQRGYLFKDRLLRAAKVVVARKGC